MDIQSKYIILRNNASPTTRSFLTEKHPYIESLLPYVYKDRHLTQDEVGDASIEEINHIVNKVASFVICKGHNKLCFPKTTIDRNSIDSLQHYYDEALGKLSGWTVKLVQESHLQNAASLIPWMEGRYIKFSHLHPDNSKIAVEMDAVVEGMLHNMKLLQREKWIISNNHQIENQHDLLFLLQRKLDRLIGTLSTRAKNIITKNNLDAIETFLSWIDSQDKDFSMLKQCGESVENELNHLASEITTYRDSFARPQDVSTTGDAIAFSTTDSNQTALIDSQYNVIKPIVESQSDYYDDSVKEKYATLIQHLSARGGHILETNGLNDFRKFIEFIQIHDGDFASLAKCGETTNEELRTMAQGLLGEKDLSMSVLNCIDINKIPHELMDFLQSQAHLFLSTKASRTREKYRELHIDTAEALLRHLVAPLGDSPINAIHGNSLVKKDIIEMITLLRSQIVSVVMGQRPSVILFPEIPMSNQIRFSKEDREFANAYMKSEGHWPMFFVLSRYFKYTNHNKEKAFATLWGIDSGEPLTIENAAMLLAYTREGIKLNSIAITHHPSATIANITEHPDWEYYRLNDYLFFTEIEGKACSEITKIAESESLPPTTVLVLLQFLGYRLLFADNNCKVSSFPSDSRPVTIAVSESLQNFLFKEAFKTIRKEINRATDHNRTFDLKQQIATNKSFWVEDGDIERYSSTVADLLSICAEPIIGRRITNNVITFTANSIDYSEELFWILKTAGEPLKKEELLRRLKEQHPDVPYTRPQQIDYWLRRDNRITYIGKSSYWKVKREDDDTSSSIRDFIIKAVSNSDKPLSKSDICEIVLSNRPDTTNRSILTIIGQCIDNEDLIEFHKDLIGLSSKDYGTDYLQMPRTFSEWAIAYKKFILDNNRMPYSGNDGFEGFLYRWFYKTSHSSTFTDEESFILEKLKELIKTVPQNHSEYIFMQNCNQYRELANNFTPGEINDDHLALFSWFVKTKKKYTTFTDKRKLMFEKLLEDITQR